jgi:hypothetical protein
VSGYNEVVILRRLTERHKKHALWLLTGDGGDETKYFDGLYGLPHGDKMVCARMAVVIRPAFWLISPMILLAFLQGKKPTWPTSERIARCQQMG